MPIFCPSYRTTEETVVASIFNDNMPAPVRVPTLRDPATAPEPQVSVPVVINMVIFTVAYEYEYNEVSWKLAY